MNISRRNRGAGWRHLVAGASSDDKEKRMVSLIRAYAWVEHALDAAQASGPRKPIARRVLRTFNDSTLSGGLSKETVRNAIGIRHSATHEDAVPSSSACVKAVETFRDIWHALSRHFVNIGTAVSIGTNIHRQHGILSVCLYGSLAREASEPNDIDLLVLDNGVYSSELGFDKYEEGTFNSVKATKDAMLLLGILSKKLVCCAECRWLDIIVMNGHLFGYDFEYTTDIRKAQPDPWFFVNISRDLREFDPTARSFMHTSRFPFEQLRRSRADLERLGFV